MSENRLRFLWCDGFAQELYLLEGRLQRITGRAWIGDGRTQAEWQFTLLLLQPPRSREEIDWPALLPADHVTCWIAVDQRSKRIEMEPAAAVPDPA
jgi:hypothetical protein